MNNCNYLKYNLVEYILLTLAKLIIFSCLFSFLEIFIIWGMRFAMLCSCQMILALFLNLMMAFMMVLALIKLSKEVEKNAIFSLNSNE